MEGDGLKYLKEIFVFKLVCNDCCRTHAVINLAWKDPKNWPDIEEFTDFQCPKCGGQLYFNGQQGFGVLMPAK